SDPQAKQNLLDALNQGKKLVNYTGHGSVDIWEANLLTDGDAATLVNAQQLSVVVAMTCLNGYFIDERIESLAHALLNAPNGGAVAMWSSSGLTLPDAQAAADFELFRQLFAGASIRLGDATIRAKTAISDVDVRRTWILIGDPTTRFRQ
ncbi:MAG TPA: C25 family cysteine peptidase, partial [Blastocatellia bacterium]|nr:C25 family cysteine peptidase [Blastocatellia bacterium]